MTSELSYSLPELGTPNATADPLIRTALSENKTVTNELIGAVNATTHPVTWYVPKAISGEQSTALTSYTTLSTPDEITGVVVPANGLLRIGYRAIWKGSAALGGAAAIFLNGNQLRRATFSGGAPATQQAELTASLSDHMLTTTTEFGLVTNQPSANSTLVTTGQVLSWGEGGGMVEVFAAPGTYAISVKFAAQAGKVVTAKERLLWVEVHGT